MSKKHSVIRDDLGINNKYGGIYCFIPFDFFDKRNKAVFKIGMTTRPLAKRGDNYHTYYPMGVTTVASLQNPTSGVKSFTNGEVRKKHYEKIEKFLMSYIIEKGGYQIISTAKSKDNGKTEWVYSDTKTIDNAFSAAHKIFGGELDNKYDFKHEEFLDDIRGKLRSQHFMAKIIYPLVDPEWQTKKGKK
jgi:hypothetical protein